MVLLSAATVQLQGQAWGQRQWQLEQEEVRRVVVKDTVGPGSSRDVLVLMSSFIVLSGVLYQEILIISRRKAQGCSV